MGRRTASSLGANRRLKSSAAACPSTSTGPLYWSTIGASCNCLRRAPICRMRSASAVLGRSCIERPYASTKSSSGMPSPAWLFAIAVSMTPGSRRVNELPSLLT